MIVTPSREIPLKTELRFRREGVAQVAGRSGKRVAFVASSDQAHTHDKSGPYGYSRKAAVYDRKAWRRSRVAGSIMKFRPWGRPGRQPVADGHARGRPGGGPDDRKALLLRGRHLLRDAVRGLHQRQCPRQASVRSCRPRASVQRRRRQSAGVPRPVIRGPLRDPPLEEKAESEGDEDEDREYEEDLVVGGHEGAHVAVGGRSPWDSTA